MFDATTSYIGLYLFTKSVKNARSGTLPGFLAVFQTSKFEVRNTARPPGSVPELTGAIPDLTDAIPDLSGSITDLNYLKKCDVRNAARSLSSVPDLNFFAYFASLLPVRSGIAPVRFEIAPVRSIPLSSRLEV